MLKKIYHIISEYPYEDEKLCLATLVSTRGSAPQVPGSSALISEKGLYSGTLGGGILEGDAIIRAADAMGSGKYQLYDFVLDGDINDKEGAICGGKATVLIDPKPEKHRDTFDQMSDSLEKGIPGLMITIIRGVSERSIQKYWYEKDQPISVDLDGKQSETKKAISTCIKNGECISLTNEIGDLLFIEPIFPLPKLIIAGAGHIGKALAHHGRLLDFEVTVIDDRDEFANHDHLPDADHIIVKAAGAALKEISITADTYIVIVTRGHKDDAEALKVCIGKQVPYIGMIGSRKKIRIMKEKFISEGWSTKEEFERIHAPIGLDIGSESVEEIALSIAAQLIQVRAALRRGKNREYISALILAAGESSRMGQPKMLMPFGETTILGSVIGRARASLIDHLYVVLGAYADKISKHLSGKDVNILINSEYHYGMLSSVQAGLRSLPGTTTAVMILLGDQPMISTEVMDRLIEQFKKSEKTILIASSDGKRGHPMIFDAKYIPEILSYNIEQSLRDLPSNYPGEVEEMNTGKPEILRDIDTPEEYKFELKNKQI